MNAEQIIKAKTEELETRREYLISMYGDGESSLSGEFLLEEAVLIEIELRNRGYKLAWRREEESEGSQKEI